MRSFLKSLITQYKWKELSNGKAIIKYTFKHPIDPNANQRINNNLPEYVDKQIGLKSINSMGQLIKKAFSMWESYTNVNFIEDNEEYSIYVFQYQSIPGSKVCGFASYPNTGNFLGVRVNHNEKWLFDYLYPSIIYKYATILHEIGHSGFGLKHPFEDPFKLEYLSKSETVMSYTFEKDINYNVIIPISPMPLDIDAVQYIYGLNNQKYNGDTIHHVGKLIPSYQWIPTLLNGYTTISSLEWDSDGNDTLSVKDIEANTFLNLKPYSRSQIGSAYLAMPNMDIENVVGGKRFNTIVLNNLNNIIDIRDSLESIIVINPRNCGHDTIVGFKGNDKLFLDIIFGTKPTFNITSNYQTEISLNQEKVNFTGFKIIFDANNTLTIDATNFSPTKHIHVYENIDDKYTYFQDFHGKASFGFGVVIAEIITDFMLGLKQCFMKIFIMLILENVVHILKLSRHLEKIKIFFMLSASLYSGLFFFGILNYLIIPLFLTQNKFVDTTIALLLALYHDHEVGNSLFMTIYKLVLASISHIAAIDVYQKYIFPLHNSNESAVRSNNFRFFKSISFLTSGAIGLKIEGIPGAIAGMALTTIITKNLR